MKPKRKKVASRILTRSNEDRINFIYQEIRSGKRRSSKELAEMLRVSEDVVHDDVAWLKTFKDLPIKVSRKGGKAGYYFSREVPEKMGSTFNERNVVNVAVANRAMATLPVKGKEGLGLDIDTISQMLVPHTKLLLDEVQQTVFFRPFAPEEIDMGMFMALSEAVRKRREVQFCYLKNMAQYPELKRVRGYCFLVAANCWYMIGRDVEKDVDRTYLVSRMSKPLVTNVRFKDPKFDLDEYLKGCFIVMKGNESHDIVLEFSDWAATYIKNRTFAHDQKLEDLPNGGVRLSFWLSCLEEVEYWVRWWGPHVKVIGSEGLRARLRKYRESLAYLG